jgi:hypothetical protein
MRKVTCVDMDAIRRAKPTSDESPPWAGMEFTLPVDSDALMEHLKTLYPFPQCSTHRERKHMAAIDFLKRELASIQSKGPFPASSGGEKMWLVSPGPTMPSSDLDESSSRNVTPSPSPAFHNVMATPVPTKHESHPVTCERNIAAPISAPQPTSTSAQHFVFSAIDGRTHQLKKKRKMTAEEKKDYKRIRTRGACARCKKAKEKV